MQNSNLSLTELEHFCHSMGCSLKSGQTFVEALHTYGRAAKWQAGEVVSAVEQGENAAGAMDASAKFPSLLVGMVEVGEASGRLDETFLRMADYYRELIRSRRVFQQGIAWPILQLVGATVTLSLLFLGLDYLQRKVAVVVPPDLFGFGLSPLQNLAVVWGSALVLAVMFVLVMWSLRRGQMPATLASMLHRIPVVGATLTRISASRFAWALGAAIDAGTDAVAAIRLAIRGSGDARLQNLEADLVQSVQRGDSFESALAATGAFPRELIQSVSLGESTGQLTECVERLSQEYDERNSHAVRRFGQVSGLLVSLFVIALLGGTVVSMYARYLQMVDGALQANSSTLDQVRDETLAAIRDESSQESTIPSAIPGADSPSENELIQTRDRMVQDFVEHNEDFKQIESTYSTLSRFNEMTPNEFLDAITGEKRAQQNSRQQRPRDGRSQPSSVKK